MERRSFLARMLFGLATPLGLVRRPPEDSAPEIIPRPAVEEGRFFFDWTETTRPEPWTNHPRYAGRLRGGYHNRVYVDGVDAGGATRFRTGADGWVERFKDGGAEWKYVEEIVEVATGRVVPRAYGPWSRVDADGKRVPIYGIRLAKEILRGHVTYCDLREGV